MWQTDGGAKQSTRHGGELKTYKPRVSANAVWPIYTSSCIKLSTNSSNDEEEFELFFADDQSAPSSNENTQLMNEPHSHIRDYRSKSSPTITPLVPKEECQTQPLSGQHAKNHKARPSIRFVYHGLSCGFLLLVLLAQGYTACGHMRSILGCAVLFRSQGIGCATVLVCIGLLIPLQKRTSSLLHELKKIVSLTYF